jgi:hypothetical protein
MLSPSTQREIQLFHYCQANIKQETTMTALRGVTVITEANNLRTSLPSCPQKQTIYVLVYLHVPI